MGGSACASRRVDDLRLLVEDGDDAIERSRRGQERVVELRQLLHRVEEVREVEREGEERSDGEAAVDDERASEAEDDRRRHRGEHVDRREVEAVQHDGLVVRGLVALVDAAEARLARRLARERLHDSHARDVLGERGGHEPETLSDAPVRAIRAHPKPRCRSAHQRQHEERREREAPVEEEEDDRGADQDEAVLDEARETVGDQLVERLDVVGDPAHDRARSIALEEAERKSLQVAEQPDAEIRERSLADPAGEVGLEAREHEGRDPRGDERDDDDGQCAEIPGGDPVVDGDLREVRRQERDDGVGDERDDCDRRAAPIGTGKSHENAEPPPRLPPGPVVDPGGPIVGEVASRLPDLHFPAF